MKRSSKSVKNGSPFHGSECSQMIFGLILYSKEKGVVEKMMLRICKTGRVLCCSEF